MGLRPRDGGGRPHATKTYCEGVGGGAAGTGAR
jgi:hypothetical protein